MQTFNEVMRETVRLRGSLDRRLNLNRTEQDMPHYVKRKFDEWWDACEVALALWRVENNKVTY